MDHRVAVPEERAAEVAERFSEALDVEHAYAWYADFKNGDIHYVAFTGRVFGFPAIARDGTPRWLSTA
jgi:hypothetical protein